MRKDKQKNAEYFKKWYYENREVQYQRIKDRARLMKEWFKEYKTALKCVACGENHISCLDFHHRDPKEKDIKLAEVINRGWGKERILLEIDKCNVLCANCHRKFHWEEKNK